MGSTALKGQVVMERQTQALNPRVVAFLAATGLTYAAISRGKGEEVKRVTIDGHTNLWTVHYMGWITRQWHAWAKTLGYTRGTAPHWDALVSGHTDAEFDAWLVRS